MPDKRFEETANMLHPYSTGVRQNARISSRDKILSACVALFATVLPACANNFAGYLIDRSCAEGLKHESKNVEAQVQHHTSVCALSADCAEAGYSIYKDGKFVDLDAKGNALAKQYFQTSKRKEGHFVTVTGDLKRDVIATSAIKEANPPSLH